MKNKIVKLPAQDVTIEQDGSYTIRGKALANVQRVSKELDLSPETAVEYLMGTGLLITG